MIEIGPFRIGAGNRDLADRIRSLTKYDWDALYELLELELTLFDADRSDYFNSPDYLQARSSLEQWLVEHHISESELADIWSWEVLPG